MKFPMLAAVLMCMLPGLLPAAPRTFTNQKGEKILADLEDATESTATIRRTSDGKRFILDIQTLIPADQKFVSDFWNKKPAVKAQKARDAKEAALREQIVKFCESKMDQQVGNGECWTLADEAFKVSGCLRPKNQLRVWGDPVDYLKDPIKPGDILEISGAEFADGSKVPQQHTAVIVGVGEKLVVTVAEQNWGRKIVQRREIDLAGLVSGSLKIYRLQVPRE